MQHQLSSMQGKCFQLILCWQKKVHFHLSRTLSGLHVDHFDDAAKEILPKDIKVFVQNEEDANEVQKAGFQNVEVLQQNTIFEGIRLSKTKAQHGRGEILKLAGHVCGIVCKHPTEKTLYVAADTVWYEGVQEEIAKHKI